MSHFRAIPCIFCRICPYVCSFFIVSLVLSPRAPAVEAVKKDAGKFSRGNHFSVGIAGQRHALKSGDKDELIGNAAAVQLGSGYVADTWYLNGSLDILLGPYEPSRDGEFDVDFVGTGLTFWTGISAQDLDLRSPEGGYGFALGLNYADVVGRSIGGNRKEDFTQGENEGSNSTLTGNYVMRVTNLSLLPGIFFTWLKEPRPEGNTPELLATRLEGYILTIGLAMPLLVNYKAEFTQRDQEGKQTPKGSLRGYTIQVALSAILGT